MLCCLEKAEMKGRGLVPDSLVYIVNNRHESTRFAPVMSPEIVLDRVVATYDDEGAVGILFEKRGPHSIRYLVNPKYSARVSVGLTRQGAETIAKAKYERFTGWVWTASVRKTHAL